MKIQKNNVVRLLAESEISALIECKSYGNFCMDVVPEGALGEQMNRK